MHKAFDAGFQLNKSTVIGDIGDPTHVHRLQRILTRNQVPRIFLQLLHAERNSVGLFVNFDDLHFDRLTNRQNLRWVVDTAPRHVGDVQQSVHTTQIDKRTIFSDVFNNTVHRHALGQVADHFGALLGAALFENCTARHHDISATAVHFQDLERLLKTHQRASITHRTDVNLRARQECNRAAKINRKAAFDATKDCAINPRLIRIGFLKTIPSFFTPGHFARNDRFAL